MKKKFFLLTLLSVGAITLASCGGASEVPVSQPIDGGDPKTPWVDYSAPVDDIRIAQSSKDIIIDNIGLSMTVDYAISPRNALKTAVDWISSDETIATVSKDDNGVVTVTGLAAGECDITAVSGKINDTAHVTVNIPIVDFELSVSSIDLDYGESFDIEVTFIPENTTFNVLDWSVSDPDLVVNGGHVVAPNKTITNGTIYVTNSQLNKTIPVTVNVTDKWNYVESIELTSSVNRLEVDHELATNCVITAIDPSKDASTLTKNSVYYESLTPEILSIDPETGVISAKEKGEGKVKALIYDERAKISVPSNILTIDVFEVRATNIEIKDYSKQTINLDNISKTSVALKPLYTLDDLLADKPSRGDISFSSSDEEVVKVSEDGVVSVVDKGEATIMMTDSYSNLFDYVKVNVTIHATKLSLSAPTNAGVGEPILLTTSLSPYDVSDDKITFSSVPSEGVEIVNNNDGTATAISHVDGLVHFTARNDTGEYEVISNDAAVSFKYVFEEGVYYLAGSRNFSNHGDEGSSWEDAGKALVLTETKEDLPEGVAKQYKTTVDLKEGDQFKLRTGDSWIDNFVWVAPSGEGEWTKVYHVENAGAVATGKMSVDDNIIVNADGKYDVYYKIMTDGDYYIYIGDTPVFRFESAPKVVELNRHVEAKIANWVNPLKEVSKNNDNIAMTFDQATGVIDITGLIVGKTIISATDAERTISYEIEVINQLADFTLAGTFNDWKANDQEYGLEKVSSDHYVIKGLEFSKNTELQAVSRESGEYFGNASTYEGCHYSLADSYGKKKLIVDLDGTYNVHIWTNGTDNPIVLKLASEDKPIVVYDYDYYIEGIDGIWEIKDQYGLIQDSIDSNHYYLNGVGLLENTEIKVFGVSEKQFIGVNKDYSDKSGDFIGVEGGNLKVLHSGTYTVNFWVKHDKGNHIYIYNEATPTYDHQWYLDLNNSINAEKGDMGSSKYFEADPNDSNVFWIKDLKVAEGDKLKAYNPNIKEWRGTNIDGNYWIMDNGDILVTTAGTYDLRLFVSHNQGNHISLLTKQENFGTGVAMVGSKNYSGSGDEGASWDDATKAYFFTIEGGDPVEGVDKQYVAEFNFEFGDLFRFRIAGSYNNILDTGDDSTAYKHGQIVMDGDNYKVSKAGTYTLYMKHYASGGWSCYIGAIKDEPVSTKVKISIDLSILKSKFGSAADSLSSFSLYAWDSNKEPLLGNWGDGKGSAAGNLGADGYVEIEVDLAKRIVGLIVYFWQKITDSVSILKQSNDMTFTYDGVGEYYIILPSGDLSWSGNTFSTLSVQKAS